MTPFNYDEYPNEMPMLMPIGISMVAGIIAAFVTATLAVLIYYWEFALPAYLIAAPGAYLLARYIVFGVIRDATFAGLSCHAEQQARIALLSQALAAHFLSQQSNTLTADAFARKITN